MTNVWETVRSVNLGKTGEVRKVDCTKLTDAVLDHIFDYGLRQIVNDAMAGASSETDETKKRELAISLADKRIGNLMEGNLRAASGRASDPVSKRAGELAELAIKANAAFKAWVAKLPDPGKDEKAKAAKAKTVNAKLADLVKAELAKGDESAFVKQAKVDVEAAKSLGAIEIEI